jgi:aspartyl-tRNA(Asn)/glutamyl-tRNA(Gln) amidotransferase subunit A
MAGRDELDSTTIDKEPSYQALPLDLAGKKVGVIKEYIGGGLDAAVKKAVEATIEKLRSAGADVSEVSLPSLPLALAVYYIICPAEVSSNLARYDGQRYGYSSPDAIELDGSYELSREQGFGAEAKRRIMIGAYVLSSGYYDAYYKKAQLVRTKIRREFDEAFKKYDFLVGPTTPTTAFKIGERAGNPLQMYLSDVMTVAANISGNPAISIPQQSDDLPVGFQIIGDYKKDASVLALARQLEVAA